MGGGGFCQGQRQPLHGGCPPATESGGWEDCVAGIGQSSVGGENAQVAGNHRLEDDSKGSTLY